jgi:hypothetical protein
MKSLLKFLAPIALAGTLFSASPAHALSDWCFTDAWPAFRIDCTTRRIPANSSGHFIYFKVSAWQGYEVEDVFTHVIIRRGNTGGGDHVETVGGLYGEYTLYIKGVAGVGYISNT